MAGLTPKERIRLLVLSMIVLLLCVVAAYLLGRTEYDVLYSDMESAQAGDVLTALEELGVPHKTQGSGTILIPRDRVSEVRMRLSADKVAPGIASTPDIYSAMGSGFGTTDEERRTYLRYQTQADLRTTINQIDKIEDSLVLLNIPNPSTVVFSEEQPPTASITLKLKENVALTNAEATGIAELVAGGTGIELQHIKVMDTRMQVYTLGAQEDSAIGVSKQMELERQVQERLQNSVKSLLSPVFGPDNISTTVSVALNFDKETVQSVEFAPPAGGEEGLVVSLSELFEFAHGEYYDGGIPGTDSNGMGTVYYPYGETEDENEHYHKILREMNLEIDETRTEIEKAQGSIRSLSIAVLLNSNSVGEGVNYNSTVRDLVAKAVGVGEALVSVQQLPFSFVDDGSGAFAQQQEFERKLMIQNYVGMALKFLVVLLLVASIFLMVRMVLKAKEDRQRVILATADGAGHSVDYLADGGVDMEGAGAEGLDVLDINTRSEGILQLERLIDKDPEAVAQLLRNWLSDDYR